MMDSIIGGALSYMTHSKAIKWSRDATSMGGWDGDGSGGS